MKIAMHVIMCMFCLRVNVTNVHRDREGGEVRDGTGDRDGDRYNQTGVNGYRERREETRDETDEP